MLGIHTNTAGFHISAYRPTRNQRILFLFTSVLNWLKASIFSHAICMCQWVPLAGVLPERWLGAIHLAGLPVIAGVQLSSWKPSCCEFLKSPHRLLHNEPKFSIRLIHDYLSYTYVMFWYPHHWGTLTFLPIPTPSVHT